MAHYPFADTMLVTHNKSSVD